MSAVGFIPEWALDLLCSGCRKMLEQLAAENPPGPPALCIGCGCDDRHACWDEAAGRPCTWLRVDRETGLGVCSMCVDHIEGWDAGERVSAA